MQSVDLNLASRPFKNDTLLWVGLVSVVALLLYASWWNIDTYTEHRAKLADLEVSQTDREQLVATLDRRGDAAVKRIKKFELPVLELKADKANGVIRSKAFSWTRLFNLLQEVQPHNVQMASILPTFRGDAQRAKNSIEDVEQVPVAVEGVAKSLLDFLALERALIRSPHFDRIDPERHTLDEDTQETVFRLRFLYDPRVALRQEAEARAAAQAMAAAETDPAQEPEQVPAADLAAEEAETADPVVAIPTPEPTPEPTAQADQADPIDEGVLATGELKKIDRRGKGRRGKKGQQEQAATQENEPVEEGER